MESAVLALGSVIDLASDEAKGEELLGAVEGGLGYLGGGGVDGEGEGVEDGVGVRG